MYGSLVTLSGNSYQRCAYDVIIALTTDCVGWYRCAIQMYELSCDWLTQTLIIIV